MKKSFPILLFLFLSFFSNAQTTDLYGLWFEQTGEMMDTFITAYGDTIIEPNGFPIGNNHLVDIDENTGIQTSQGIVPDLNGIVLGSSTFDHFNKRFIFWGVDDQNIRRIYNLDVSNGFIVNNAPLASLAPPIELEYDLKEDILYGYSNSKIYSVDLLTGAQTLVGSYPTIQAVVAGSSTFDSNLGHYIVLGADGAGGKSLYTIDMKSGAIVYSAPIPVGYLAELQFDVSTNTVYGMHKPTLSSQTVYWSSIDQQTGVITDILLIPQMSTYNAGVGLGTSTYHQATQSFMAFVSSPANGRQLLILNALTGQVTSAAPLLENFVELECDNTEFANAYYNKINTGLESPVVAQFEVFPNPTNELLTVDLSNDFAIELYAASGQLLKVFRQHNGALSVADLASGIYLLRAENEGQVFQAKFVKE